MEVKIEHRLTELESRTKSNTHRLDDVEKRQDKLDDLVGTVRLLADREKRVEDDVGEIKSDVKSLKQKPGQKWDSFVDKAFWAVVAAVIGFIMARLGIGG